MRKSYSTKLRSSQCKISKDESINISTQRKSFQHKNKIESSCNLKKLSYDKHRQIGHKPMSHRKEYNKEIHFSTETSNNADKSNFKSRKRCDDEDDDNDDSLPLCYYIKHRKKYNIRKRSTKETTSNTKVINSELPEQIHNSHDSSALGYEACRERYNMLKSLTKEISRNSDVNNSISEIHFTKETSGKTDKKKFKSSKRNDDDGGGGGDDPNDDSLPLCYYIKHRKEYNIRKRSTKETTSNTKVINSESPEQIHNGHDSSGLGYEACRERYNMLKSLTKEISRNTDVNNSKSEIHFTKETSGKTDKKIFKSSKRNDDDDGGGGDDPNDDSLPLCYYIKHRKEYNIRKRSTKETTSNTKVINSESPEQIHNSHDSSALGYEACRERYNILKSLTKEISRNTDVNNSKSEKYFTKETSNNTDNKHNFISQKRNDDDGNDDNDDSLPLCYYIKHRKKYNIRKRSAKETTSNTKVINSELPEQIHNSHDSSALGYEACKQRYNMLKCLTKEISWNTDVNNSKYPEQINKNEKTVKLQSSVLSHEPHRKIYKRRQHLIKDTFKKTNVKKSKYVNRISTSDQDNDVKDLYEPPRKPYNTRKQHSNNYETSASYDFLNIGGMKRVKAVRWDHPTIKSNNKEKSEKKCGMVVKNITIENICKFNNIHYSKPVFNKTQFSRIYVDELNMLLSIHPIQRDDKLVSVNRITTRRKCKVLRKYSLTNINQQSDKTDVININKNKDIEQLSPQTLKHSNEKMIDSICNEGINVDSTHVSLLNSHCDFINNEFPRIFLKRLPLPSTTQSDNLLFNNKDSYDSFVSQDGHYNQDSKDSSQNTNEICTVSVNIENMEQQKIVNGFVKKKVKIVAEKTYPLRNRNVMLID